MLDTFLMAFGLVCIIEGLLPFLAPQFWRRMMQQMLGQTDRTLQVFGLISMLVGLAIVYFFST